MRIDIDAFRSELYLLLIVAAWADRRVEEERALKLAARKKAAEGNEKASEDKKTETAQEEVKREDAECDKPREAETNESEQVSDGKEAGGDDEEDDLEDKENEAEAVELSEEAQLLLEGQWKCSACTLHNPLDCPRCLACDTPMKTESEKEEIEVPIPKWKTEKWYRKRLQQLIDQFLPYIRFPMMTPAQLEIVEGSGLVPREYITEVNN
jgi:hypothetical protein